MYMTNTTLKYRKFLDSIELVIKLLRQILRFCINEYKAKLNCIYDPTFRQFSPVSPSWADLKSSRGFLCEGWGHLLIRWWPFNKFVELTTIFISIQSMMIHLEFMYSRGTKITPRNDVGPYYKKIVLLPRILVVSLRVTVSA
jgi:hypothetical protein